MKLVHLNMYLTDTIRLTRELRMELDKPTPDKDAINNIKFQIDRNLSIYNSHIAFLEVP